MLRLLICSLIISLTWPSMALAPSLLEQRQRMAFMVYAETVNAMKSPQQFYRFFQSDLKPKDRKLFAQMMKKVKKLPTLKVTAENTLEIQSEGKVWIIHISKDTPNKYKIGNYDWIYDPSTSFQIQQKVLWNILEKVDADQRNASFGDWFLPKAHAFPPAAIAVGAVAMAAARFAAPWIVRGGAASLRWAGSMLGKIVENTIPSAVGSVVGGGITAAAIIARQDQIPYGRALACLTSNFRAESCEQEAVQTEIQEVATIAEDLQLTVNQCPTTDNRTFSWTMFNERTRTKIIRLATYNADGVITEMLEFHASPISGATTGNGLPLYQLDTSRTIAYQFDSTGRLETVRRATFRGDIPVERQGDAQNRIRPALVISGESLNDEQKLIAATNRARWLADNRVRTDGTQQGDENPELIILDRVGAETGDGNARESWDQYRRVVSFMRQIQPTWCGGITQATADGSTGTPVVPPADQGQN